MGKSFKKSTPKEIQEMFNLYKQGISYRDIGKKLGKHHSTIIWHIKRGKIPARTWLKRTRLKKPQLEKPKKEIIKLDRNLCIICKKQKEKKWEKTLYCSMRCWDYSMEKKKFGKWHQTNFWQRYLFEAGKSY